MSSPVANENGEEDDQQEEEEGSPPKYEDLLPSYQIGIEMPDALDSEDEEDNVPILQRQRREDVAVQIEVWYLLLSDEKKIDNQIHAQITEKNLC